jgi:hypothetical protein
MRVNGFFMKLNKFKEKISYFFKLLFFSIFLHEKTIKNSIKKKKKENNKHIFKCY